MTELVRQAGLSDILVKLEAGERLSAADGLALFENPSLLAVGALANRVRERRHGDLCYFNRNLHINATNVCEANCIFCSFARLKTGEPAAWTLSIEQAVERVRALSDVLVTEVHIVNGLNPDLPFAYYTDLVRALKAARPDLHIKGFTAVEIHYYAQKYGMSIQQVLESLMDAGLQSMPGGGAEIFAERARRKLCHDKVDAKGWLEVHRIAHRLGLSTNATMLFGSIETLAERVDHLLRLRALQDESLGLGPAAFQTMIPLRFHNQNNRLQRLRAPTGQDSLRTIAVSRLLLDNVPHIKAYWPMLGLRTAQLALHFGADDLDGTVREEHVYHMAGASTPQGLDRHELVRLVRQARRKPVERDTLYRVVRRDDPVQPAAFGKQEVPLPRIGAVGYANTWPLVRFLGEPGPVHVRTGHPADVATWLAEGQIDLALLPVGALLCDPGLRVVPDLCIGCDGPVDSVLLVAETSPESWTRVVLDGVSRTSVLLARLLLSRSPLAQRTRPDLEIVDGAPGSGLRSATGTTAALIIGDVARDLPQRLSTRLDLGRLWKDWTGLPFVFAVWAGRPNVHPAVVERVRAAGRTGLGKLDLAPAEDRDYLRERIRFVLDDAAMMGLRRFAALALEAGLVPQADVDLYLPRMDLPPSRVAAEPPFIDLAAAAHLRASRMDSPSQVRYELARRVPVMASAAAARASLCTLRQAGGGRVELLDATGSADLAAWSKQARRLSADPGLAVVVADAFPVIQRLALATGRTPAQVADQLNQAGARAFELVLGVDTGTEDLARHLAENTEASLHLVLPHGDGAVAPRVRQILAWARDLARLSHQVRTFTVRSLHADRVAVDPADNTAVGWLRLVALARLALPDDVAIVASPQSEGLDTVQAGLSAGATSLGPLHLGEGIIAGAPSFAEARIEIERAVESGGRQPVCEGPDGAKLRPALGRAGRTRPLPSQQPAR